MPGLGQIPGASSLTQQDLSCEVVALGIGKAEQVVHRSRALLMEQHGGTGQGVSGGNHPQLNLGAPLLGKGFLQQGLQTLRGVHHRGIDGIACHSQACDRGAIGRGAVVKTPGLGPPGLGGLLGQLEGHQGRQFAAPAPAAKGQLGKTLQLGQGKVGIPLANQAVAPAGQPPQLGGQAVIRSELVEGKGRADQLLVGSRDARPQAVEIGEQTALGIGHRDAPDRGLRSNRRQDPLLQGRATDLLRKQGKPNRRWRRRQGGHRWCIQRRQLLGTAGRG